MVLSLVTGVRIPVSVAPGPPRSERMLPDGTVEVFTFPDRAALVYFSSGVLAYFTSAAPT